MAGAAVNVKGGGMLPRIDHVTVAVRDLGEAVERFQRLGFKVTRGGRLTHTGTRNALIHLGLQCIELLAVDSTTRAGREELAGPTLVNMVTEHDGALLGYSIATDRLREIVEREGFRRGVTGFTVDPPYEMRRQVDGGEVVWRMAVPGGAVWRRPWPALVQWETPDVARAKLEPAPNHENGVTGISGVALGVANMDTAIVIYRDALGLNEPSMDEVSSLGAQRATFRVGEGSIHLLRGTTAGPLSDYISSWGEGLFEVMLETGDVERTQAALARAGFAADGAAGGTGRLVVPPDAVYGLRLVVERQVSGVGAQAVEAG
jgi:catechol 2,3-dioxygenase-like lactoylglutathione lyase family enzyme